VDEKAIQRLRIEHLLATYRREGANRRALEKERARLERLSMPELAALHLATARRSGAASAEADGQAGQRRA
jgi:hypothetical protein